MIIIEKVCRSHCLLEDLCHRLDNLGKLDIDRNGHAVEMVQKYLKNY